VIYYLFGIQFLKIIYNKEYQIIIIIVSDILFANDSDTQHSSQSYVIFLFGEIIIWKVIRQSTITILSTKTKLFVLKFIAKEIIVFKRLFRNLALILSDL
jgi:hypothetical protein